MGEVQGPWSCVTADPSDGSVVALKHLTDACFAVKRRIRKLQINEYDKCNVISESRGC